MTQEMKQKLTDRDTYGEIFEFVQIKFEFDNFKEPFARLMA